MRRYDEIMDKLTVTPEMRARILQKAADGAGAAKSAQLVKFQTRYRAFISVAACLAVVLTAAFLLPHLVSGPSQQTEPTAQIAADIVDYATPEELSQAVGFPVREVSGLPFAVESETYTAYWKELAEINYAGADGASACFRQSAGTDDNSGDYNDYAEETTADAGGVQATLKGTAGGYTLAVWTDGTYAYSLSLSSPLSAADWTALIKEVK